MINMKLEIVKCKDTEDVSRRLEDYVRDGDAILFKASHSFGFEKVAKSFIEKSGYSFPIYFDKDESALYAYYVYSIPATYFISSDGTLAAYARGMINEEALTEGIGLMK